MRTAQRMYPKAIKSLTRLHNRLQISYVYQDKPSGEIDAIYHAKNLLTNDPFAIIYPDDFHFPTGKILKGLCQIFKKYNKNTIALTLVDKYNYTLIGNTGRINLTKINESLFNIDNFLIKTMGHFKLRFNKELRTCGYMISRPDIFDYIDKLRGNQTTNEFTDIIIRREMLKRNQFLGYKANTMFFDVGNPSGYHKCLKTFE